MEDRHISENQKDLPFNASSAIKQIEKHHAELISKKNKYYNCINQSDKYQPSSNNRGLNTLGDVDSSIAEYCSIFRDCLSHVEAFMHDVMLTKMENGTDFENYERFCTGLDGVKEKLVDMISEIYEFQKEHDIQRGQDEYIIKSLLTRHRERQKQNIDYLIRQMDSVRRYYNQLIQPSSEQKCRIC